MGRRPVPLTDYPTSVRLPADVKHRLRFYARQEQRDLSWLVVQILKQWVSWKDKEQQKSDK